MTQNETQPLIQISGLTKVYTDQIAVDHVHLEIYPGEFFCLLGGSGSGKSTLLRMLAGFEAPTEGRILIDGKDVSMIPPYQRPVNMMFQSYALFPHMTVEQNVSFGLKQDHLPDDLVQMRTYEMLDMVEMTAYAKRKPHQLSGGQCQRVALARSMAKRPKALLLDEPLSALDKKLREQMQFELVDIQESTGITFIMVTHDQAEAMTMASRIGIMERGALVQVGRPQEVYEFPANYYAANFLGQANFFTVKVQENHSELLKLVSDDVPAQFVRYKGVDASPGQSLRLGLRPEKITISKNPPEDYNPFCPINCLQGRVDNIAYLGGVSTYYVELENGQTVKVTDFNVERQSDHPTWEDEVYLTWSPESMMVLTS